MKTHKLQVIRVLVFYGVFMLFTANCSSAQTGAQGKLEPRNLHDNSDTLVSSAQKGDLQAVKAFLEAGISIETKDEHGRTALIAAAANGRVGVVKFLVEQGVNINARDQKDNTALAHTIEGEYLDVARILLEAGAEIEMQYRWASPELAVAVLFPRKHLLGTAVSLALFEEFAYEKTMAFSSIATALITVGHTRQAEVVLQQARAFSVSITDAKAKNMALRTLAVAFAEAGNIATAQEVAASITDTYHQSRGLSGIAMALTEAGNIRKALEVVLSITDAEEQTWEFLRITPLIAETGDIEKALEIVRPITDPERRDQGLRHIAEALAEAGNVEKALEITQTIENIDTKAPALSAIAAAFAKEGDIGQAVAIVNQAQELALSLTDASAKVMTFVGIAQAFVTIGDAGQAEAALNQAREAAGSIEMAFSQILSLRRIAHAFADMGKPGQVEVVLKQAQEVAGSARNADTTLTALRLIAETFAKTGDSKQAEAVLAQAQEIAMSIDYVELKTQSLGTIAKAFAELESIRQAEAVLNLGIEELQATQDESNTIRAFLNIAATALSIHFDEAQQTELANTLMTAFLHAIQVEVKPGKVGVLFRDSGDPAPASQRLVSRDSPYRGIIKEVLEPGVHSLHPEKYSLEIVDAVIVPEGKIGVMIRMAGKSPPSGTIPVERESEYYGIIREVLKPGSYYLNPYEIEVEFASPVSIPDGFVGVIVSKTGKSAPVDQLLVEEGFRGVRKDYLKQGLYDINPYEFDIVPVDTRPQKYATTSAPEQGDSAVSDVLTFLSNDGARISIDVAVLYEIPPENAPYVVATLGRNVVDYIQTKIIRPGVRSFARLEGSLLQAVDFVSNDTRENFQKKLVASLRQEAAREKFTIIEVVFNNYGLPEEIKKQVP